MTDRDQRIASGAPGFDRILNGGLIHNRMYLIEGNPGAGKTTLALQFLLEGMRASERCLYVTLCESKQELEAGARAHGWSLDGIVILELIPAEMDLEEDEQLTMLPVAEVELGETLRKVIATIEQCAPQRLVFDSLSELRLLAQTSLRYRRQILALKRFLTNRNCTSLMLDDRTSEEGDRQLHSIAHGVVALDSHVSAYGPMRRTLQVAKFRGSDFASGSHDFVIRRGGLQVFPRLIAAEHSVSFPAAMIASGVRELDELLGGGIDRGTSTLLVGPPGCGKSTVALQYAAAAVARGDHAAVFMFDESKMALLTRAAGLGVAINEGTSPGTIALHQIDPVTLSPGEFVNLVRESVEINHASVLVIDSLNGYLNAMPHSQFLIAQLHELLSYLNNLGVTTFLVVAQSGMIGANMTSPVDTSYLADGVMLMRYFEHKGTVKKAVSITKRRTGRHESTIRELWFDGKGIHLSEPLMNLRGVLTGVPVEMMNDMDARHYNQKLYDSDKPHGGG